MEAGKSATNHNDNSVAETKMFSDSLQRADSAICLLDFLLLFLLLKGRVVAQVFPTHVLRRGKNDHLLIP